TRRRDLRRSGHPRSGDGHPAQRGVRGQRSRPSLGFAARPLRSAAMIELAPQPATLAKASSRALFGLAVLSLINFFNYLDRYIVAGVLPLVESELHIDHERAGLLASMFIIVYMLASPVGGYLGDRIQRRFLVAGVVFIWSLATIGSGLASSFAVLLLARAMIGIGEAGYGSVAPALISDLFPRSMRTRMLAFFYVALPLRAAAGVWARGGGGGAF